MVKYNFIRVLQVSLLALMANAVGAQQVEFTTHWQYFAYGTAIGEAGIADHDIDGDGTSELVFTSTMLGEYHNNLWSVQTYDEDRDDYKIAWQSGLYTSGLGRLILYSTESIAKRAVVGRRDGVVEVWQLDNLTQVGEFDLDSPVEDIVFADSDNNGIAELLLLTSESIYWVDAATFEILASEPNRSSARKIAVGNVDEDPAREIVLETGLVLEKTSETTLIEWDEDGLFPGWPGFGDEVLLQDIDNDGIAEIIAARRFREITAISVVDRSIIWSFDPEEEINALSVIDYDEDGTAELVFGEGQHGNLQVLDMQTREQLYKVYNPTSGFSSLHFARIHGDGEPRFIWGGGYNSSAPDYLHVAGASSGLEWSSPALEGPFKAIDVADVDLDGNLEYVFSSTGYWHLDSYGIAQHRLGLMGVVDESPPTLEWVSSSSSWANFSWAFSHDVLVADVDDDGVPEIVLAGEVDGVGTIHIIDAQTNVIRRTIWLDESSPIYKLAVADVDGDGSAEIIAAAGKGSTGVESVHAYFVDGHSGEVKWRSPDLFDPMVRAYERGLFADSKDIKVANVDDDSALEVIVAFGDVLIIDGVSRSMDRIQVSFYDNEITNGLATLDIDQDGVDDIFFATGKGELYQVDVDSMTVHLVEQLCSVLKGLEHLENGWLAYSCSATDEYYGSSDYGPRDSLRLMNVYTRETVWSALVNGLTGMGGDSIEAWSNENSWYLGLGTHQDVTVFRHEGLYLPQESSEGFSYVPPMEGDTGSSEDDDNDVEGVDGGGSGGGALTPFVIFLLIALHLRKIASCRYCFLKLASRCKTCLLPSIPLNCNRR